MRFLTIKQVNQLTGLSATTIRRLMKAGNFPKNRKLSPQGRASRWLESEIYEWMSACEIAE